MRSEWQKILKLSYKPRIFWELLIIANGTILRRFCNIFFTNRTTLYPINVRKLLKNCALSNYKSLKINDNLFNLKKGPRRLKIATGWLNFDKLPNWHTNLLEFEQYVSLHRWNWLLRSLTDEIEPANFEWGISLVRSWVLTMGFRPKGEASESYTTGERISNLCLFARSTNGIWTSLPNDLSNFVREMGLDLARRIEYNPGKLNGNHIINNARALLFAGHCTNTSELVVVGRAIITDRLKMLVKDGFLIEGSSHYQLLFTRWLLEIALLAEERNDQKTTVLIYSFLPYLLESCNFFLVKKKNDNYLIPTLGDISPDAEPDWLKDLFSSPMLCSINKNHGKGWANLFSNAHQLPIKFNNKQKKWNAFPKTGWFRLNFFGWVAIWHAETSSGKAIPSHSHHDVCSLVLFLNGREILIDPGRYNYNNKGFGYYGYTANSHNTLTIDGLPPMLSRGDRFIPAHYRQADCSVTHQFKNQKVLIKISHNGFSRLGKGIGLHTRTFTFSEKDLLIEDQIEGKGCFLIETYFHQNLGNIKNIPHGLFQVLPKKINLFDKVTSENHPELKPQYLIANEQPFGGWRCPSYGVREPALTTAFSGKTKLPVSYTYRITNLKV